jgi:flagellin
MGLRINTNVSSIAAQRSLASSNKQKENTLGKLSSGSRIVKASDDAAGLAISEKLKATIRSTVQADRNANDGISLIQTAEGGLNEISSILIRLRELAVQSSSDTIGNTERGFSNLEFQSLKEEIQRISASTEYNGTKLLNGQGDKLDFQIGANNNEMEDRVSYDVEKINANLEGIGITELTIESKTQARDVLDSVDGALNNISGMRAELGATQNRLTSTSQGLQVMRENLSAANSRIRDTDFAQESANNARLNILTSAGSTVLTQANNTGAAALKLLG